MKIFGNQHKSASDLAPGGRKRTLMVAGFVITSGIVLVCLVTYLSLRGLNARPPDKPARLPIADLVSISGMVLAQNSGGAEWREVHSGANFCEGDLVRTDNSGGAVIRYRKGATVSLSRNTVLTIRNPEDNQMEISASPGGTGVPPLWLAAENGPGASGIREGLVVELYQIIPFGRSLELIGRVEAGNSLVVNNEMVEISGDGSFKHFTSPFPASASLARLNLKVTDLAGRSRVWAATHDFRVSGREE